MSELARRQSGGVGDPKSEIRDLKIRHTWDIIDAAERGLLPDKIMINMHPQRWTDNLVEWTKELGCGFMMPIERAIGNCLLRSLGL